MSKRLRSKPLALIPGACLGAIAMIAVIALAPTTTWLAVWLGCLLGLAVFLALVLVKS